MKDIEIISKINLSLNFANLEPLYETFHDIFTSTLDAISPLKTRFLRVNDKPHMTRILRKAIMTRARLKNIANSINILRLKAQGNLVVHLNKKIKTSISCKGVEVVKLFGRLANFSSQKKVLTRSRIILVDHNEIVSGDQEIATVFNSYFSTITSSLPISRWNLNFIPSSDDPVINALIKFKDHPSISKDHPSIIIIRNRISSE